MERWNGLDWTGMVEWNGMEWNAESNGVLRRMRTWYHLLSYDNILKFLSCGAVSLGYYQGGDGLRGLEHSFAQAGHELTAGIDSYFTPLGNTAIKCWSMTYNLDHVEI